MINNGSSMKISGKGDSSRSSKPGPSRKPKKDFQKVLSKEKREDQKKDPKHFVSRRDTPVQEKESFDEISDQLSTEKTTVKTKGPSLFDLAGAKEEAVEEIEPVAQDEEIPAAELTAEIREESLSALFKGFGNKEKLKSIQQEVEAKPLPETPLPKSTAKEPKRTTPSATPSAPIPIEKDQDRFTQEQPDLSGVNPFAGTQAASAPQIHTVQEAQPLRSHLQEIVDQIIDKLYTVERSGRTDTLIKLRHPPLFAGSGVVITSFDTAKKEFNITFENLTAAAKQILDLRENQDALKFALEQKGYTVHIITATTLSETVDLVAGKTSERGSKEEGDYPSQSDDERQEEKEE